MGKAVSLTKKLFINKVTLWPFATAKRRNISIVILLGILLMQINSANKPDYEVDVYEVRSNEFVQSVTASGEVKAERASDLSFVAAEVIEEIFVKDGAWVEKGDSIAKLNTVNLYNSYQAAEQNLRAYQAALDSTYDLLQGKDNTETFAEISSRTSAEATRDSAVFAKIQAQRNLANATIRAPFAGVVNYKEGVSIGEYASAVMPSFSLIDPDTVYFEAEISELEVSKLKLGMKAIIELDAYNEKYEQEVGMIGFTSTVTSSGGTAYKVKISLPNNEKNKYRLGMNGDVEFIVDTREDVLTIPLTALTELEDGEYVWIVDNSGRVTKIKVETGKSSINDVEILSGLNPGDKVVERAPSKLEDGNKVEEK